MEVRENNLTNRGEGKKLPFQVHKVWEPQKGVKAALVEADFWEGPTEAGRDGRWRRMKWVEYSHTVHTDKDGGLVRKPRKPSSCSFEHELHQALKRKTKHTSE